MPKWDVPRDAFKSDSSFVVACGEKRMAQAEISVDVLVVGTGASGMATAVTAASQGLKVLVVEKEARFGGTTARSGGWLWIPGTRLATEQGIKEPPGAAKAYLKHETTTHFDEKRVDAFLENGPKAIDFFTQQHLRAVRHAGGVSRLPRRGPRRTAGRPLDGHAAVRRARVGRTHQTTRAAAARAHRVRNDAGLRTRDQTFHARVQVADLVRLRHQATEQAFPRCDRAWPRHDAHERQRARRSPGEGRDGSGHSGVAFFPREESWSRNTTGWPAPWSSTKARRSASKPSAASCWHAAGFRTTSSAENNCSRMHRPARSTTRRRPRRIPATACAWRRQSADASTERFLTRRPGCRHRSPRDPTARRA